MISNIGNVGATFREYFLHKILRFENCGVLISNMISIFTNIGTTDTEIRHFRSQVQRFLSLDNTLQFLKF